MKPLASVSMDLDNEWTYLKTHGDPAWRSLPSYLGRLAPRVVGVLSRLGLRITFFVVGQDAALVANRDALAMLTAAGHEVGNHSFHHEPWLHLYDEGEIRGEIESAHEFVMRATGREPVGFRGPGYSWSEPLLKVLSDLRYRFDASTLPTFIGPVARAYYFRKSEFGSEERARRSRLFGSIGDGCRPNKPYLWRLSDGRTLLEIPVTTMPLSRLPFHLSYLIYLWRLSPGLMRTYLKTALGLCLAFGVEPSFLLHPLDLLGGDDVPGMAFFPGMEIAGRAKEEVFCEVLGELAGRYALVCMSMHAESLLRRNVGSVDASKR